MNTVITVLLWIAYFVSLFFAVFWLLTFLVNPKSHAPRRLKRFPKVSVIIPAYNEEDNVKESIESVVHLDYPKNKLEIIVVNDGSKDHTKKVVEEYIKNHPKENVILINQKNKGKGAALNAGLKKCTGEFFVCLDADSMPKPDVLHLLLPPFDEDKNVACSLPALKVAKSRKLLQKLQHYEYIVNMFYKELMAKLDCIRVAPGPFSVYRTSVLRKLGGFDEDYNLTEDLEMALRLQKNNYKLVQTLETWVYTKPPKTIKALYYQRNRWYKGSIMNTLDYKTMIFNKKWGDFGVMTMPTTLISGAITIIIVLALIYYTLKPIVKGVYQLSLVNFDIWTFIKNWQLNFAVLDINFSLVLVGVAMLITSLYVLKKSHLINQEKLFGQGLIPLFFYAIMYFVLLGVMWIGIAFDLVFRRRQKW